jgi:hypothetical protein
MGPCASFHPPFEDLPSDSGRSTPSEKFVYLLDTLDTCLSARDMAQNSPIKEVKRIDLFSGVNLLDGEARIPLPAGRMPHFPVRRTRL